MFSLRNRASQKQEDVELEDIAVDKEQCRLIESSQVPDGEGFVDHRYHDSRFRALIRSLKLQLLRSLVGWRAPTEHAKIALYKDFLVAILETLLHLPPLIGAVTLIALNLSNRTLGSRPFETIPLLFVAKLHELLMQLSISAMLLSHINQQACKEYIPFGLLFAPKRVADVSLLWSLEFWSSVTSSSLSKQRRIFTALFLLYCIILAALLGPSSAAAMIPRPITTKLRSAKLRSIPPLQLEQTPAMYFPDLIQEKFVSNISGEYLELLSTMWMPGEVKLLHWNFTTVDMNLTRLLQVSLLVEDRQLPTVLAFMPTYPMSDRLASEEAWDVIRYLDWHKFDGPDVNLMAQTYQSIVSVRCATEEWDLLRLPSSSIRGPHPNGKGIMDFPFLNDVKERILFSISNTSITNSSLKQNVEWISPPVNLSYSAIAVFSGLNSYPERSTIQITACGIVVSWRKARYVLRWGSINFDVFTEPSQTVSSKSSNYIRIQEPWMRNVFESLRFFRTRDLEPYNISKLEEDEQKPSLEVALASAFAHGLSNVYVKHHPNNSYVPCGEDSLLGECATSIPTWNKTCPIDFNTTDESCNMLLYTVELSGNGWSASTTPVLLSLIVLGLYCILTAAYLVRLLTTRTACTAWDSAAELVTLALQSKHPEIDNLKNTSVGIETMATFREPVGIRANEIDRQELVFMNDADYDKRVLKKVEANKAY